MSLLLELISSRVELRRVAVGPQGPEYAGPCPLCGGSDRFHVWPEQETGGKCGAGRFWCRRCDIKGDAIEYLRQVDGMSFREACARLGLALPDRQQEQRYQAPPALPRAQGFTPRADEVSRALIAAKWSEAAETFLAAAQARLRATKSAQEWLSARGLNERAIRVFGLGYHESSRGGDSYRRRADWGLPEKTGKDGQPKKLWLPAGWVIANRDSAGRLLQLRIRRRPADIARFGEGIKYLPVEGSGQASMVLYPRAEVFVVVESGFDAILIANQFSGKVGAVTGWNSSARPDARAHEILSRSALILGALDYDQGGDAQQEWWAREYRQYRRLPALPGGAKDPGDAVKAGVNVFAWVRDGMPWMMARKLGLGGKPRQQTPDAPQVVEITRPNGQVIYATDDKASWHSYAAAGQVVLTGHEIQRMERAIAGEKDREACIDAICLVKKIFPGAYIRGGRKGK